MSRCLLGSQPPAQGSPPPQACWPTWWSRTSQCGVVKGSVSADSTSSESLTGGNAHVPTRPSASEDCWS